MWLQKRFVCGAAGMLALVLTVMPVSAHGHHDKQVQVPANAICGVCTIADCTKAGLHIHDEKIYCGYAHENGYCDGSCGAVGTCTVEGCTETGQHVHDTVTYCGYAHASGYCDGSCGAVEICPVAGCTESGQHMHDTVTYCGYAHASGYCDHSCEKVVTPAVGSNSGHHGYHGHH